MALEWTPARIRLLRAAGLCLSQDKFATALGFTKRTVGNAERGAHPPSLALRRALDQALENASDASATASGDPDVLPRADAIAVAPTTFNTINKWSAGISDTCALGIPNEAFGLKLPTIVAPYAKPTLAAHPEFDRSLEKLNAWGVNVLPNEVIRAKVEKQDGAAKDEPAPSFDWQPVMDAFEP